jgi:acetyl esterase/lipase
METVMENPDVQFKQTPERDLLANVFRPPPERRRNTTVICIHGGVWNRGERSFFND